MRLGGDFNICPVVKGLIEQEIKQHVNSDGRVFEKIRNFAIIPPLSVEQGTLTGKEEPVRGRIEEQNAELIESLYANPADWMK